MEMVEDYVSEGSNMQRRDAQDVVEEFSFELSKMRGRCLDIGSGPGDITKEMLLPILPHDTEVVGEQMKIWRHAFPFHEEPCVAFAGADISQAMVNYARKYSDDKRLSYIVLDIETELPSDQVEQYDNAVSFYCLHWCNDIWYLFMTIEERKFCKMSFKKEFS